MKTGIDILLPENDPDLALARRIGSFLEDRQQEPGDDRLEAVLYDWKTQSESQMSVIHVDSESIWQVIESTIAALPAETVQTDKTFASTVTVSSTGKPTVKSAPVFRLSGWIWSAAATLLIVLFAGYFVISSRQQFGPYSANKTVSLTDGTEVVLRKNSTLSFSDGFFKTVRSARLTGEAKFIVAKRNKQKPFHLMSGNALIAVTGTIFYVQNSGFKTTLFLEEGSVDISGGSGGTLSLTPGEFVTVTDSQPPVLIKKTAAGTITDWINNRLIFEETPLKDVLIDLSLHFGLEFDLEPDLLEEPLTGELLLETEAQVLSDLGIALGGRFELHGTTYRFIRQ